MRKLRHDEQADLTSLGERSDAVAPFEVTQTQLDKSIIDATDVIRHALRSTDMHDYGTQGQGPDHKVTREVVIASGGSSVKSRMSLYRPKTKDGDPRFWLGASFRQVAAAGEVWALAVDDGEVFATPLGTTAGSGPSAAEAVGGADAFQLDLLRSKSIESDHRDSADRLLARLEALAASGWYTVDVTGDTAVGMALEAALGIEPNVSKGPDWEGVIEIKSHRARSSKSMNTIISLVPDWTLTGFQDRNAILDHFGRPSPDHDGRLRLYNTMSALGPNSHGLELEVDHDRDLLYARHAPTGERAFGWRLELLRERLSRKHSETMWVKTRSRSIDRGEEFRVVHITHTAGPKVWNLGPLLESGALTVDTTIGEKPDGSARDHGWLFRMRRSDIERLFPTIATYDLAA